jgi:predicted Zn finger-like uncharacterized protein
MANIMACKSCGSQLRVRDEYLGRAMKCPKCGQTIQAGDEVEADVRADVPKVNPIPGPIREAQARPRPVVLQPADDDVPEVRPKKRQRQGGWEGEGEGEGEGEVDVRRRAPVSGGFAPCPKCGNNDAERVLFTFWGSFHITNLVCHVQCPSCGTCYNGRTGRSNFLVALLCVMIPLLLILAVIGALAWWLLVGAAGSGAR